MSNWDIEYAKYAAVHRQAASRETSWEDALKESWNLMKYAKTPDQETCVLENQKIIMKKLNKSK